MALIQYNGNNLLNCGLARGGFVRILPGINEVDANIVDKKLLNKLIKTDGRPAVIEAAKAQLASFDVKPEDKAKDLDDEPMHFN